MRKLDPYPLWIGSIIDGWSLPGIHDAGIRAVVDLASNEAPIRVSRDLVYCRFPIVDGARNDRNMLRLAVDTVESLLRDNVPTIVFCSAGLSRSPAVAAAAISRLSHQSLADCLAMITAGHAHDVAAGLIVDMQELLSL